MKRSCCFLIFLFVGCTGGSGVELEETVPVTGIATYQGKPLEDYRVSFSAPDHRTATGMVGADGKFTLGTNSTDDGAPVGTHKVWLTYAPVVAMEAGNEQTDVVPPKPKVKLPAKYTSQEKSGLTVEVPPEGLADYKLELE